jgi:hypothetical protein
MPNMKTKFKEPMSKSGSQTNIVNGRQNTKVKNLSQKLNRRNKFKKTYFIN